MPAGGGRSAARPRVPGAAAVADGGDEGGRPGRGPAALEAGRGDGAMERGSKAVTIWARGESAQSAGAKRYLGMVDAGSGREMVERCERIWPHYGEVVRSRKHCVARLAMLHLSGGRIGQAVILGAGLDPLSVEIAERTGCAVASYEIDAHPPRLKPGWIARASPGAAGCIRHVRADLAGGTEAVAGALAEEGWRADMPSLVVAEGISYYLPEEALRGLLGMFRTRDGSGRIILEYLRDPGSIRADRARIPDAVFGEFVRGAGVGGLARYSDAQAAGIAAGDGGGGGGVAGVGGMSTIGPAAMERDRTGGNRLFADDRSGWIAVCHGPI